MYYDINLSIILNTGKSFIYACLVSQLSEEHPNFVKELLLKLIDEFQNILQELNFISSKNLLLFIAELYNLGIKRVLIDL